MTVLINHVNGSNGIHNAYSKERGRERGASRGAAAPCRDLHEKGLRVWVSKCKIWGVGHRAKSLGIRN